MTDSAYRNRISGTDRPIVPERVLESFLAEVGRTSDVIALKILLDRLSEEGSLDRVFRDPDGLFLSARDFGNGTYEVEVGCHAGPMEGDGASWLIRITDDGQAELVEQGIAWLG